MNLTKCFAASLCVTALTASAGFVNTNDFENGGFDAVTWTGGVLPSAIVNASTGFTDGDSPLVGVGDGKLLRLDTEGGVWTNEVASGGSFALTPVYVDMLVKFVPSEELPTLDSSVKLAVAVTNGFLVVTKGGSVWNSTTQPIDTNLWYRFSAELKVINTSNWVPEDPEGYWEVGATKNASVKINGNPVTVGGENVFLISDFLGSTTLTSIGFQGTGFIDEVTVRTDDPFAPTTVQFGGTGPEVDPLELNAWKLANSIVGTEDPDSFNAFVMNVAPELDGTSPVLVVNSIVIDGTTTLTVMAKYANDDLVALGTLNNSAVLTVWGKVELDDVAWANLGTDLSDFDQTTYKFFTVTTGETPTL